MSLEDYRHLETADITIDYSKLGDDFWKSFSDIVNKNNKKFEEIRKSTTPTYEDMHKPFDL